MTAHATSIARPRLGSGETLTRWKLLWRYRMKFGRFPRLDPPVGFNEHITHRLIYDRDPLLKIISDKLAVKQFIAERAGAHYNVPLLGAWERAEDIAWSTLPDQFVLKPNQTSGPFAIVRAAADRDTIKLTAEARQWLRDDGLEINREWGYRGLPRRVMAEPLLLGHDGDAVPEINVFTFGGKAKLIRLFFGQKLSKARRDAWFDFDGRQLNIKTRKVASERKTFPAEHRDALIESAEKVSAGISSLRVDYYDSSAGLLIGELTPYSWGGRCIWSTPDADDKLGRLWHDDGTTAIFDNYVD